MNITANAASLSWRSNNHGVWKALVKNMTPDSSVTFSDGLTGTVAGRQVTVESPTMPTGFMTYTTDDTAAVFGGVLYGAGTAYDSLEAVSGGKTVRIGSYTFTGNETWMRDSGYSAWYYTGLSTKAKGSTNLCMADYLTANAESNMPNKSITGHATTVAIYVKDSSYTDDASLFAAHMAGKTIYYELATPTTSTETAQPMSLAQGSDTIGGGSFSATYEGTEYELPLYKNNVYIYRDGQGVDTVVKPSANTTQHVIGGIDKLIDLSHWFGMYLEPSLADFYKLYPTWKNNDIPYIRGQILNYKGTGVQTIGFNAYNHATGTAVLLGGNKYQICGTYESVSYVDQWGTAETLEPDADGIFTPVNNGTLTVIGGNGTDTCVHLCWSGYKDFGEPDYEWQPYTETDTLFPISTYFPDGMNGIAIKASASASATPVVYRDELSAGSYIQRLGVKVFDGTESWTKSTTSAGQTYFYCNISGKTLSPTFYSGEDTMWDWFKPIKQVGGSYYGTMVDYSYQASFSTNNVNLSLYVPGCETVADIQNATKGSVFVFLKQTAYAGTLQPTAIPEKLNLLYPVNDFGTEQSLPVNTTTLVTTDLNADIKYSQDFTRLLVHYSDMYPTVKTLVEDEPNLMRKDDVAPNATVGNAYNLIDRNAAGTERQFSFDTAGGTQDITDGTAVAKKIMGTTLNLNQLVHDTNENTVTGDGQVEVEDAVAGDVKSLVVEGRSLVKNQLVPLSLEETEDSANGAIEVSDAVAGDALALKMTAPRSVVVNQLLTPSPSQSETLGLTKTNNQDGSITIFGTCASTTYFTLTSNFAAISGHVYFVCLKGAESYVNGYLYFNGTGTSAGVYYFRQTVVTAGNKNIMIHVTEGDTINLTIYPMAVDLTQYFNGDQTLINSITSWDDLVAYDPRFASYVEYNTGTVEGVQPQVKVTGKNLIDQSIHAVGTWYNDIFGSTTLNGGVMLPSGTYTASVRLNGEIATNKRVLVRANEEYIDGNNGYGNGYKTFTLTTPSIVNVQAYRSGDLTGITVQLELGSDATAYEPYHDGGTAQAPAPLFAVGNAADEFEAVAGVTTRKIGSYTFTGNESFSIVGTDVFYCLMPDMAVGVRMVMSSDYVNSTSSTWQGMTDKTIKGGVNNSNQQTIYIKDSSYSTTTDFKTHMAGKTIYYELATPTTTQSTPTQITLQSGNNTAMQTDGGHLAPFSLTYDGTEFTLPLDNTHKYAFSDNGTKSIVTNASEQAVTGGQDMLVDVTRMFNGDTTDINAITSWADMAAIMPAYLSNVAYNEGEVVGRSGGLTATSGGSATFSDLHGVGTAKDTLDVITGEKTVKIGSYTFTGNETWNPYATGGAWYYALNTKANGAYNVLLAGYIGSTLSNIINKSYGVCGASSNNEVYVRDADYPIGNDASAFATHMAGKTIYYELAEPVSVEDTPQPLTLVAGLNNVHEENMNITGTPLTMEYTGTDYVIATKSARVYLKDVDGTVERVTGVTSIPVRGGRDNVMDLTRMFGLGLEPGTLDAFYSLFPAWRGYKLPYNEGSLLNFKGTGLKSVGFNQFNGVYSEEGKYLTSTGTLTANTSYNVTDYLRAVPGQTYRLTTYGNAPSICWYTYDKTFISGTAYGHASTWQEDVFTAPANAYWVRFSVYMPKEAETCFYFQWSGPRNGDYEPYWDYTRPIPTLTYFPDGMNGRGNVYDEINDRQAIRRFGVVDLGTLEWTASGNGAWTTTLSGMKSLSPMLISSEGYDISASGTTLTVTSDSEPIGDMVYELATPVVTTFSEEISTTARISDFGTEECLPANGYVPVTTPFRGMVLYQDDYARTITKLPENYQSQDSMDNLLALLGSLHNGTITSTFDSANQVYTYQFTPNA